MTPENAVEQLRKQAQRQHSREALRKRMAQAGMTRLEVWAHPDDHPQIKAVATRLQRKRQT